MGRSQVLLLPMERSLVVPLPMELSQVVPLPMEPSLVVPYGPDPSPADVVERGAGFFEPFGTLGSPLVSESAAITAPADAVGEPIGGGIERGARFCLPF